MSNFKCHKIHIIREKATILTISFNFLANAITKALKQTSKSKTSLKIEY